MSVNSSHSTLFWTRLIDYSTLCLWTHLTPHYSDPGLLTTARYVCELILPHTILTQAYWLQHVMSVNSSHSTLFWTRPIDYSTLCLWTHLTPHYSDPGLLTTARYVCELISLHTILNQAYWLQHVMSVNSSYSTLFWPRPIDYSTSCLWTHLTPHYSDPGLLTTVRYVCELISLHTILTQAYWLQHVMSVNSSYSTLFWPRPIDYSTLCLWTHLTPHYFEPGLLTTARYVSELILLHTILTQAYWLQHVMSVNSSYSTLFWPRPIDYSTLCLWTHLTPHYSDPGLLTTARYVCELILLHTILNQAYWLQHVMSVNSSYSTLFWPRPIDYSTLCLWTHLTPHYSDPGLLTTARYVCELISLHTILNQAYWLQHVMSVNSSYSTLFWPRSIDYSTLCLWTHLTPHYSDPGLLTTARYVCELILLHTILTQAYWLQHVMSVNSSHSTLFWTRPIDYSTLCQWTHLTPHYSDPGLLTTARYVCELILLHTILTQAYWLQHVMPVNSSHSTLFWPRPIDYSTLCQWTHLTPHYSDPGLLTTARYVCELISLHTILTQAYWLQHVMSVNSSHSTLFWTRLIDYSTLCLWTHLTPHYSDPGLLTTARYVCELISLHTILNQAYWLQHVMSVNSSYSTLFWPRPIDYSTLCLWTHLTPHYSDPGLLTTARYVCELILLHTILTQAYWLQHVMSVNSSYLTLFWTRPIDYSTLCLWTHLTPHYSDPGLLTTARYVCEFILLHTILTQAYWLQHVMSVNSSHSTLFWTRPIDYSTLCQWTHLTPHYSDPGLLTTARYVCELILLHTILTQAYWLQHVMSVNSSYSTLFWPRPIDYSTLCLWTHLTPHYFEPGLLTTARYVSELILLHTILTHAYWLQHVMSVNSSYSTLFWPRPIDYSTLCLWTHLTPHYFEPGLLTTARYVSELILLHTILTQAYWLQHVMSVNSSYSTLFWPRPIDYSTLCLWTHLTPHYFEPGLLTTARYVCELISLHTILNQAYWLQHVMSVNSSHSTLFWTRPIDYSTLCLWTHLTPDYSDPGLLTTARYVGELISLHTILP